MAEENNQSEDFKEAETPKKNLIPKGKSGTLVTGYEVQNDYLKKLLGEAGQEMWAKMLLSDSQIRKVVHAVNNPIKSAKWTIEPFAEEEKYIKQAELIEQILFKDLVGGWKSKLDEILTFPWHGHAVFEKVHGNKKSRKFGNYTGLKGLGFRDQRTLDQWHFDRDSGELKKIHQTQSGEIEVNEFMEADTLVIFFNEKKGSDTGFPFCRMMYGNYKRKLLYKELQAIGIEKGAIGTPIVIMPEGVDNDDEAFAAVEAQLTNYVQAENAYFILPAGYDLKLDQNNTFDPSKVQVAIKAENEEISGSVIAMWLEMGIGGNSAVGTSTTSTVEFFRDGIEYLADKITDTINLELIPELIHMNFGEQDGYPILKHNGIADEAGKELMEVVTGYVKGGVITADEPLETHVRNAHNLPKKDDSIKEEEVIPPTPKEKVEVPQEEDVELNDKGNSPRSLMKNQASIISDSIRETLSSSSNKYIIDTLNRYQKLNGPKKQNATTTVVMSGKAHLRASLKSILTDTAFQSIDMARLEVPTKKDISLNNHERDMIRMVEKYGESIKDIKLNEISKLPSFIQVLIARQAQLISEDSLNELKSRLDFSFSSILLRTQDENLIRQAMEDEANDFIEGNSVRIKGENVSALIVNEGRTSFFFEPDVLEEIHSFTFMNIDPKAPICKELTGKTIATNDAQSMYYNPPLHHGCKSYLRANLKTSRGVNQLQITAWAPSAEAKKSISL